jgi:hypothetical protein
MSSTAPRNRLKPWIIGLVLILVADAYAAWSLLTDNCAQPAMTLIMVLVIMPGVYLALMYATLTSQE